MTLQLAVHKNRFWLAHRNGRVCAESFVPMVGGNPYRKGSKSWRAFNASYQERMLTMDEQWPIRARSTQSGDRG